MLPFPVKIYPFEIFTRVVSKCVINPPSKQNEIFNDHTWIGLNIDVKLVENDVMRICRAETVMEGHGLTHGVNTAVHLLLRAYERKKILCARALILFLSGKCQTVSLGIAFLLPDVIRAAAICWKSLSQKFVMRSPASIRKVLRTAARCRSRQSVSTNITKSWFDAAST